MNNRGYAFLVQGAFDDAEHDFLAAVSLDPNSEVALANLASLYLNTERHTEARPLIERLLILDPENTGYQMLLSAIQI